MMKFEARLYVVVEGLKESTKEGIVNELNGYLNLDMQPTDIKSCYKMIPRDTVRDNRNYKTKIIFNHQETKDSIFKAKNKLRNTDVWINDDLTSFKSELAFTARNAKRAGKIENTWVFDGHVYITLRGDDRPRRITTVKDIPEK